MNTKQKQYPLKTYPDVVDDHKETVPSGHSGTAAPVNLQTQGSWTACTQPAHAHNIPNTSMERVVAVNSTPSNCY